MDLPEVILNYADKHGQFNFREIRRYCQQQMETTDSMLDSAISGCLRRLKSGGYIWNKRDIWYLRKRASLTSRSIARSLEEAARH